MSNEKDDDLTIRDKFAIAILQSVLSNSEVTASRKFGLIDYLDSFDSKNTTYSKEAFQSMERRIRACYMLADIMRKVRLTTFE